MEKRILGKTNSLNVSAVDKGCVALYRCQLIIKLWR